MKLQDEYVYSEILDKNFQNNIANSPVWDKCHKKEDLPKGFKGYAYKVAFDGLKPVQVKSTKKITN